jgi:hypothetical protein
VDEARVLSQGTEHLPALVLALALAAALSACGGSAATSHRRRAEGPYQLSQELIYNGHRCQPLKSGGWRCGGNLIAIGVQNGSP